MKEMKEDLNIWRANPGLWIVILNVTQLSVPPKLIHQFNASLSQSQKFFCVYRYDYFKNYMERKRFWNGQRNFEK